MFASDRRASACREPKFLCLKTYKNHLPGCLSFLSFRASLLSETPSLPFLAFLPSLKRSLDRYSETERNSWGGMIRDDLCWVRAQGVFASLPDPRESVWEWEMEIRSSPNAFKRKTKGLFTAFTHFARTSGMDPPLLEPAWLVRPPNTVLMFLLRLLPTRCMFVVG